MSFAAQSDDTDPRPWLDFITEHESIKLNSSVHVLSGLILPEKVVLAFTRPMFQLTGTFDSSYPFSFKEAHVASISRNLGSCLSVQGAVESSKPSLCSR